ncbi:MAG: hypothetical protein COA33_005405 [Fluviicola sp.]|nr:hypothetical protein [Fluviicola sp.]
MIKKFLAVGVVAFSLASCGGPGAAEYDAAAQTLCDCMAEKSVEAEEDDLGLDIDMTGLDYALCALDVAFDVDVSDEQLTKSIESKCPDLAETHAEYVKGL